MGTNYYLHQPPKPCPTCNHDPIDPEGLHIGKSSMGWVWIWHGYRAEDNVGANLSTPEEWFAYLGLEIDKGAKIRDEYWQDCSLESLRARVIGKRGGQLRNSRIADSSAVHVDGDDFGFYEFS